MPRAIRPALALEALAMLAAACSQIPDPFAAPTEQPRGAGAATDDLKRSPCACVEIEEFKRTRGARG